MPGKKKHVAKGPITPTITQELLAEYAHLAKLCQAKDEMRREIMDLLDMGADVEPGPHTVELKESEQVHATWANLKALLGPQKVQWLRGHIQPTTSRRLIVRGDEG